MGTLRVQSTVRVRTQPTERTGTLDNGTPWRVRDVEVIDADDNKVVLRLRDGVSVEAGKPYVLTLDVETDQRLKAKALCVEAAPVNAAAAAAR